MLPCLEDDAVLGTQLAQLACGQHGVAFILHHLRGEACDSQFCCWSEHYGARPSTRSQRKCFCVFYLSLKGILRHCETFLAVGQSVPLPDCGGVTVGNCFEPSVDGCKQALWEKNCHRAAFFLYNMSRVRARFEGVVCVSVLLRVNMPQFSER